MVLRTFFANLFWSKGVNWWRTPWIIWKKWSGIRLLKNWKKGRFEGPCYSPPFIQHLGIVPKKEPNSFKLIHHLSYPAGDSLNDPISEAMTTVTYASFEDALGKLRLLGSGTLLAKADIKSVFWLLPIHLESFSSLGFFFDKYLAIGCTLSCFYFESFSTVWFFLNDSLLGWFFIFRFFLYSFSPEILFWGL